MSSSRLKKDPIAVTSRSFCKNAILKQELLDRYENVLFNDEGLVLGGRDLVDFLRGRSKAITGLEVIDENVLKHLPELKVIGKYGVGLDMLDLDAFAKYGVQLGWTGGVNRRSVSELALSFALALFHRVPPSHTELRTGTWRQHIGRLLSGKTVGIIGCGFVGKDLVKLLQPFGCRVLTYDIRSYEDFYRQNAVTPVSLDELLRTSDVVTLHVPLDNSTRGLLSAEKLELMKPTSYLINTARGGLVDEARLEQMLATRRLAGAAFDVFAVEPAPNKSLIDSPYFLCTPHIGGSAEEVMLAMGRAAIAGLDEYLSVEAFRQKFA